MQTLFKREKDRVANVPYNWPSVSCVSFIKALSQGLPNQPDYRHWENMSETECLIEISRQGTDKVANYIKEHIKALGPDWVDARQPATAGDIVFAGKAWGVFVKPCENLDGSIFYESVHWQSPEGWPAVMFPDGKGSYWSMTPVWGMKKVQAYDWIITHKRRRDA